MSVVIETTLGDLTVDLFLRERPRACLNFLKLCKIKYYNYSLFHTISRGFVAQTGDPTGSRTGGESIFGVLEGASKRYFEGETVPRIKHATAGMVSFVGDEQGMIGSQFFFTLAADLTYLDGQHCVFGEVVEGQDVLELLNEVICDTDNRPYQDVRITHTVILDDPLPDPSSLKIPERSPSPTPERLKGGRIAPDEEIDETAGKSIEEINEMIAEREAKARATILEMVGDIPDADIAPPENVLFVCKLNPVTNDDDLEIIFSRFGKIKSCEVIRDKKTGDSLQYAFVDFEERKACEDAYFKMDNVLIDDRRIHVDFSQSVAKVKWYGKGRVAHFDERGRKVGGGDKEIGRGNYKAVKSRSENGKSNEQRREHRKRDEYENGRHRKREERDRRDYRRDVEERRRERSRSRERRRDRRREQSEDRYKGSRKRKDESVDRARSNKRENERSERHKYTSGDKLSGRKESRRKKRGDNSSDSESEDDKKSRKKNKKKRKVPESDSEESSSSDDDRKKQKKRKKDKKKRKKNRDSSSD